MSKREQLTSFFTERPVAVLMTFTAAVLFGFFSYERLPLTLMPELTYPTLTVRTEYPGAAPEEVENDISRPIEEALGVIGGLKRISSISRAGVSDVVLEFTWGTDMNEATQNTLEKMDLVFLPREANRPLLLHFDPSLDPIMELSFSGEGDRYEGEQGLRRLRRIAELQVKRLLEPIKGVAAVRVRGGLEEEIHVLLDEEALRRANLSIQSVITRLSDENINVAGGTVKEGRSEFMVRTLNEFADLEQIEETVVASIDGRNLRVKDLGVVKRSHKEIEIVTNTDGNESVQIDIYKEADANMVTLAKAITTIIGEVPEPEEDKPEDEQAGDDEDEKPAFLQGTESVAAMLYREEGARLEIVADRSTFIESSINEVRDTAILGGLLAVLVLFLFLRNIKSTAIIALSIPMSLLITFAPLNLYGVSLNIMSLGGLALGIGMLVDSSIVVLESIFRCQEEGDGIKTSAVRGTMEVRGAVFASILTSIAVFFPMVFVEGIAGQAFGDLGTAVVISLLASLLVALFFIPMLASRQANLAGNLDRPRNLLKIVTPGEAIRHYKGLTGAAKVFQTPFFIIRLILGPVVEVLIKLLLFIGITLIAGLLRRFLVPVFGGLLFVLSWLPLKLVNGLMTVLEKTYPKTIRWTLRNPIPMLGIVAVCFWATWEVGRSLETELLPEVFQGEFTFEVRLPVGTPIEETERALAAVEDALLADKDDIRNILVTYGYDVTNTRRSDEGEHTAKFKILLEPSRDQAATEARVMNRLRTHFSSVPDLDLRVDRPVLFSATTPVEVEIHGDDLRRLKIYGTQARDIIAGLDGLADVEASLKAGAPEVQVIYDRDKINQLGLNIGQVARQVRDMVKGNEATRFNMKDRRVPIVVRLEQSDRDRLEDIGRLAVNPGSDRPVPLSAVAELVIGEGPSEVRRVDGRRVALVNANLAGASLGTAVQNIQSALQREIDWPADMSFNIAGQSEEWDNSRNSLWLAMALSIFLVYVIMAAQFESLVQPLIIMFTIPLAFFGSVLGLKALSINLSVVVFLGMIMLAGIVVNNAIVLVDYINTLRRRGLEVFEAIVTAGKVRLRPILMTTTTTVLGLMPMALGLGDGAEIRTPMAISVVCGLITSTFLTLLVVPTIYLLFDKAVHMIFSEQKVKAEEATGNTREVPA
ncbi:MAG: efflux RND transporter permease subunit [Acidobacteriota bacterium]|nr:efflux RND transporter permease subunit [Acidobacteriota bacterium]